MLRIHVENETNAVRLRLEGKLIHPWVDELFRTWMDTSPRIPGHWGVLVDLSEVSFVDARGGGASGEGDPYGHCRALHELERSNGVRGKDRQAFAG